MDAHDPRQHHACYHSDQSESVVLQADDLMVKAEDILADEACGRSVNGCVYRHVRHGLCLAMEWHSRPGVALRTTETSWTATSTTSRNLPATSRSNRTSCCSGPGRKAGCKQSRTCRPWSR